VFLVGSRHPEHVEYPFPAGSVVIDPWRYIPSRDDITVIPVGVNSVLEDPASAAIAAGAEPAGG
jgi:hypothetical protein